MWTIGRSQRVEKKIYRPIVRKIRYVHLSLITYDSICGVMVSVLLSSAVDHKFEPSTKNEAFGRKCKDWLARNQNNVSEWKDMSTCELFP